MVSRFHSYKGSHLTVFVTNEFFSVSYGFLASLETCHWFVFGSSLYYTEPTKYRKFNNFKVHLTAVIKKLIKI